eukprot:1107686-Amorphochlora_amoeboformis.AAC.1
MLAASDTKRGRARNSSCSWSGRGTRRCLSRHVEGKKGGSIRNGGPVRQLTLEGDTVCRYTRVLWGSACNLGRPYAGEQRCLMRASLRPEWVVKGQMAYVKRVVMSEKERDNAISEFDAVVGNYARSRTSTTTIFTSASPTILRQLGTKSALSFRPHKQAM